MWSLCQQGRGLSSVQLLPWTRFLISVEETTVNQENLCSSAPGRMAQKINNGTVFYAKLADWSPHFFCPTPHTHT